MRKSCNKGFAHRTVPCAPPQVYGVEIVKEAVLAAKKNAEENHLTNCEFIAGDVLKVLEETEFPHPDCIVLDPPRDGVHPKALPKILSAEAPTILYISCKPTSLARDLPAFFEAGYQVTRMCAVDMFPRTGNVETVVLLSKNFERPKDFVQIGIDAEDYYSIKDVK